MDSNFDLDAYYAEQDRIWAIPVEDPADYLKRRAIERQNRRKAAASKTEQKVAIFTSESREDTTAVSTSNPQYHEDLGPLTLQDSVPTPQLESAAEESRNISYRCHLCDKQAWNSAESITTTCSCSLKRKASDAIDFVEIKRRKSDEGRSPQPANINDNDIMPEEACAENMPENFACVSKEPVVNHIDASITHETIDEFTSVLSMIPPTTTHPEKASREQKTTTEIAPSFSKKISDSSKHCADKELSAVVSEAASPISSFSKSVILPPAKHLQKTQIVDQAVIKPIPIKNAKAKKPASRNKASPSKMKPAAAPKDAPDPPSSPIDDPSFSVSYAAAASDAEPRHLDITPAKSMLDVLREKIAQHSAKNTREKVMKVKRNDTEKPETSTSSIFAHVSSETSKVSSSILARGNVSAAVSSAPSRKEKGNAAAVKAKEKAKPKILTKGKKESDKLTPAQFANKIREEWATKSNKPWKREYLEGKNILLVTGETGKASEGTRKKMNLILKHGANLISIYNPDVVTHIVIAFKNEYMTQQELGISSLKDIPEHIPTITWDWMVDAIQCGSPQRLDEYSIYAAYGSRIYAGLSRPLGVNKGKGKATAANTKVVSRPSYHKISKSSSPLYLSDSENEDPGPSNSAGALPSPRHSPRPKGAPAQASSSAIQTVVPSAEEDPLAEFYAEAIAQQDNSFWYDDTNEQANYLCGPYTKRGFTCDNMQIPRTGGCPNQDVIDTLEQLKKIHETKMGDGEKWRTFSYNKSIPAIRSHPKRIRSLEEARSIRGVGEKTAEKIMEIINTSRLRRLMHEDNDVVKTIHLFQGIYGVGLTTAYQWYNAGCRTLEDLKTGRHGVKLNQSQNIGLEFYDDINDRMPRAEVKALFDLIKPIALAIDPKLFLEIMGSYRRGQADCGDIDIIITRPTDDGKTHAGVLTRLLIELRRAGIITEDLALHAPKQSDVPKHSEDLEAIYRGLCRLPMKGSRRRRIDFLTVPWNAKGAAFIYYTGDDIFNRSMRLKAGKMGYSLNQRGLFAGVVRDPQNRTAKLNDGYLIASETEREIFDILGVPWQEPHERVRNY